MLVLANGVQDSVFYNHDNAGRPSIMANGTIAFDTLSTSGQISGTAKSVDTDYLAYGTKNLGINLQITAHSIYGSLNVSSLTDGGTGLYSYYKFF
jgi:hypothetical protein